MDNNNQEQILDKLDKIISYLHFQTFDKLVKCLPEILDTDSKKLVFQACNGKTGINEIASITNVIPMTVSNYVKKFETFGIVISKDYKNKKCPLKIEDLENLGMQLPKKLSVISNNNQEQLTSSN